MRIGKWAPLYGRMLPIPRRLALAFGLTEGSELHLAPIDDTAERHKFGCEIMVSPVPFQSWRSVCRFSVRLQDRPHALATATGFLREKRINLLLSETCGTYQQRAHWDAVCDLSETSGYARFQDSIRETYEQNMNDFLLGLTNEFHEYMEDSQHRQAFLLGSAKNAMFSTITGLNDASFACSHFRSEKLEYKAGGIELPKNLVSAISINCGLDEFDLPKYAIITGNTEQRYLRVLFLKEYHNMFRLSVRTDLRSFAGGGIGVLNQFLRSLPNEVNLIKASNHILEKGSNIERSHIELIGHWDLSNMISYQKAKREYMKDKLSQIVNSIVLEDADGKKHGGAMELVEFSSPDTVYPRVFISYSTSFEKEKLKYLMNSLWENNFEPVLGTDYGQIRNTAPLAGPRVAPDVSHQAFQPIRTCVAFISLQVKRNDFKVVENDGQNIYERFILPPWSIAEEVFAWSEGVLIIRLKDTDIEDPRYNRHIQTITFSSNDDYGNAVQKVIDELNKFRESPDYNNAKSRARLAQYQEAYLPIES